LNNKPNLNDIITTEIATPIGPLLAAASNKGLCLLEFMDRKNLEAQLNQLKKYFSANIIAGTSPFLGELSPQLLEYFNGKRKVFNVPLDVPATDFQTKVWLALQTIPYGKTVSYQTQAIAIENPKAVRAVAKANSANRIAIIIPCHRVIGKDGSMTGYAGKIWRKEYLLELEANN